MQNDFYNDCIDFCYKVAYALERFRHKVACALEWFRHKVAYALERFRHKVAYALERFCTPTYDERYALPRLPVRNILARVGDKIPSMLIYRTYHKCKKASCLMGVGREAFLVLIVFSYSVGE